MKQILTAAILMFVLTAATITPAQADETLFGSHGWDNGGMVAWNLGVTGLNGDVVTATGWRGQWLINHQLGITLAGYKTQNSADYRNQDQNYGLDLEWGGFEVEYIHNSDALIHPSAMLGIGGGKVDASSRGTQFSESDEFFYIQPGLGVEVNVFDWCRVSGMAGYRFVNGVEMMSLEDADLSGFTLGASIKLGWF